jgi:hypothetical protein
VELAHRLEDVAVARVIEVLGAQAVQLVNGFVAQKDGAEDALLGVEIALAAYVVPSAHVPSSAANGRTSCDRRRAAISQ